MFPQHSGESEVSDFDAVGAVGAVEQNVFRFEVAVAVADPVGVKRFPFGKWICKKSNAEVCGGNRPVQIRWLSKQNRI
jgi:hypothetical protein